ncbi:MAG: hypothetical protein FWD47_12835 [Treponema sp.]|nr:hypothetical protein [Treponema sp.]
MEITDQEYEKLKNDADSFNAGKEVWCPTKFKKEWISRVFIAWLVLTIIFCFVIFFKIPIPTNILLFLGGVTLIFMLEKPVGNMISNAKINAEFKAGLSKTINADTAKMINAEKGAS